MAILVRPAAAADIEVAFRWYEDKRAGFGDEFLAELQEAVASLEAHPKQYPVLYRETRRSFVHRFPYGIFYRVYGNDVVVVACMHARQDPKVWKARIE
ncbi:MAG: type II toxin-antitoxin system RelE/ParE family toxin [Acidobacteria bacterium]|nr:type II toxin-antitoxin system RelE/ParE family toxin [Acidobacteriota bacterium]